MKFFSKNSNKEINYLELTPVRNFEHEYKDKNAVVLVPRFRDWFFGKLLQPKLKHKYIKVDLDQFGTATWEAIDGNKKISEIALELDSKFGKQIHPVYDRLTEFLKNLFQNGLIDFKEYKKG